MSKFQVLNAFLPTGVIGPLREVARVWKSLSGLKMKMREEMQGQLKRQEKS